MGMSSLNFICSSMAAQCCCIKRHHQVQPLSPVYSTGDFMFQVKPHRVLRIVRQMPNLNEQKQGLPHVVSVTSIANCNDEPRTIEQHVSVTHIRAEIPNATERLSKCDETFQDLLFRDIAEQLVLAAIFHGFQEYLKSITNLANTQNTGLNTLQFDKIHFTEHERLISISQNGINGYAENGISNPAFSETASTCDQMLDESATDDKNISIFTKKKEEASEIEHTSESTRTDEVVNTMNLNSCLRSFCECDSITSQSTDASGADGSNASQDNSSTNEKPLLFFIHGVGGSANMWHMQMAYFSQRGFESVAVDLIGHGFSSMPNSAKEYTFKAILNDLVTVFDRFCKQHNIIIGHSYGCSLAAAMLQERSAKISRLVLISGGGPISLSPHSGILSLPACIVACMKPFVSCGLQRRALYSATGRQMIYCSEYELPRYVLHHIRQGQKWPEGDISFYKQIKIPTLLIYGMRDPYITLVEECEMEKAISRASLELIPDAGHLVMLDAPHSVSVLIQRFLKTSEKRNGKGPFLQRRNTIQEISILVVIRVLVPMHATLFAMFYIDFERWIITHTCTGFFPIVFFNHVQRMVKFCAATAPIELLETLNPGCRF